MNALLLLLSLAPWSSLIKEVKEWKHAFRQGNTGTLFPASTPDNMHCAGFVQTFFFINVPMWIQDFSSKLSKLTLSKGWGWGVGEYQLFHLKRNCKDFPKTTTTTNTQYCLLWTLALYHRLKYEEHVCFYSTMNYHQTWRIIISNLFTLSGNVKLSSSLQSLVLIILGK